MTLNTSEIFDQICEIMTPFNIKAISIETGTTFASDLELDGYACCN
jgi:hypothetical protein